jgi:hypothetical protein
LGAVRAIYDETANEIKEMGWRREIPISGLREITKTKLRYCLQDSTLFLPKDEDIIRNEHRMSWIRIRSEHVDSHPYLFEFNKKLPIIAPELYSMYDIGNGLTYCRRFTEEGGNRVAVKELCPQKLIDEISEHPEVLDDINSREFEKLIAELYARMGYEIELRRGVKDGGLDFLAIKNEERDPYIIVVECKHPIKKNTIGVGFVEKLYGVGTWNDAEQSILVTSSKFSSGAEKFAMKKQDEIHLHDGKKVLEWIYEYRWNVDE